MAVVVLLALAATLVAVRMDVFSDEARLRAAARSIGAHLRLASQEARLRGEPRLIEYMADGSMTIDAPRMHSARWRWEAGREFQIAGSLTFERLLQNDEIDIDYLTVRIGPDGRYPMHGIVVNWANVVGGILVDPLYTVRWGWLNTSAVNSLADLRAELERSHEVR